MKSISKSAAELLAAHSAIAKEDAEICSYGLEIFFSSLLELVAIFIISAFVGNFLETVLFFAFFVPLRVYAGGYHADTKLKCFLVSIAVYLVFSFVLAYLPASLYIPMIISELIFTSIMVLAKAPVVHYNKSVNLSERKVYRKISLYIAFAEVVIILALLLIVENKIFALSLALGQLGESLSMAAALIKPKIIGK